MGVEALDSEPGSLEDLTPEVAEETKPKIDLKIDWTSVNLDEVVLPEDDDLGIARWGQASCSRRKQPVLQQAKADQFRCMGQPSGSPRGQPVPGGA